VIRITDRRATFGYGLKGEDRHREWYAQREITMAVKDDVTKTPYRCRQTDTVRQAAKLMKIHDVGSAPVTDCDEAASRS